MKYNDPYYSAINYEKIRPHYIWENGKNDEEIINEFLNKICYSCQRHFQKSLEIGCGTGRFSKILSKYSKIVYATDPSDSMISYCSKNLNLNNCFFIKINAENITQTNLIKNCELITAFWSISYPLQSFFGLQLKNGKIKQTINNDAALYEMLFFLDNFFRRGKKYLFIFFDPYSIEQKWVSKIWSELGEFPGGKRDYVWNEFQKKLNTLQDSFKISYENIKGSLICKNENELVQTFMEHHLRGLIPIITNKDQLIDRLLKDMKPYKINNQYRIPSGFYLIKIGF